jgi:hypothetical protein
MPAGPVLDIEPRHGDIGDSQERCRPRRTESGSRALSGALKIALHDRLNGISVTGVRVRRSASGCHTRFHPPAAAAFAAVLPVAAYKIL